MGIWKIVSGGQTGVDRAALDAAMLLGLQVGGWCPRGRRAEDGVVPARYPLQETFSRAYFERTEKNVLGSDATLVICRGRPDGGTKLTIDFARRRHKRPCFVVDLDAPCLPGLVADWLAQGQIGVLNVAGPRESRSPGIGALAGAFLEQVLSGPGAARSGAGAA